MSNTSQKVSVPKVPIQPVSSSQDPKIEEQVTESDSKSPSERLSREEISELLGASVDDLEEFEKFRQLSKEKRALAYGQSDATLPSRAQKEEPLLEGGKVMVYPLVTENRLRVGPNFYQFTARKALAVPAEIVPILVEKGIIAPPSHTI